jgi:tetratricopeptide (TPR) repeat protein
MTRIEMPLEDRFGLPLSTTSEAAVENYIAGLDLLMSANAGAEARLDAALAADPDFALAHIAKARLCQVQARIPEAKAAAVEARARATRVSGREARHIETIAQAVDGAGPRAMALLEEHVAEYPRDALVLSLALGVFGLLGFSGRLDHHEAQLTLLERLAPRWDDDWWFLAYLGWARIELGDIARGAAEVERALQGNPRNAFAAHARTHGYFEAGEPDAGAAFIESWLPGYDRRSQLHCHLSWHLALFELARGNTKRARELYADAIRPAVSQAPPLFNLADAASFLWRWQIYHAGPPLAGAWLEVAAHAHQYFPSAGMHFADIHAILADAAAGNSTAANGRVAQTRERDAAGRSPQGAVVPALCAGAAAFARGNDDEAITRLGAALPELARVGGSHAQREVFEDTYIVACLRAGEREKATARLTARLARRPSARDERWLAEATEAR